MLIFSLEPEMPRTSPALRHQPDRDGPVTPPTPSDRLADLEAAVAEMQHTLDMQFRRMAAMQAEIDRLTAKNRNR